MFEKFENKISRNKINEKIVMIVEKVKTAIFFNLIKNPPLQVFETKKAV